MKDLQYIPTVVDFARDIIDMQAELQELREENFRLLEVERRYQELLTSSREHSQHMVGGLLMLAARGQIIDTKA